MLALLFGVLALILFFQSFRFAKLLSALCVVAMLGLYPCYAQVTAALFVLKTILDLINGEQAKVSIRRALTILALNSLAGAVYYLGWKVALRIWGIQPTGAPNGLTSLKAFGTAGTLELIKSAYLLIFKALIHPDTYHVTLVRVSNICFLILGSVGFVRALLSVSGDEKDLQWQRHSTRATAALSALILFCAIIFSNAVYVDIDLRDKTALSTFTRVLVQMEKVDGYTPGETPVVIVGDLNNTSLAVRRPGFYHSSDPVIENRMLGTTYYNAYENYFKYILAYPIHLVHQIAAKEFAERNAAKVMDMPAFPKDGCCRLIEDTLVVKLSDPSAPSE